MISEVVDSDICENASVMLLTSEDSGVDSVSEDAAINSVMSEDVSVDSSLAKGVSDKSFSNVVVVDSVISEVKNVDSDISGNTTVDSNISETETVTSVLLCNGAEESVSDLRVDSFTLYDVAVDFIVSETVRFKSAVPEGVDVDSSPNVVANDSSEDVVFISADVRSNAWVVSVPAAVNSVIP